MQTDVIDALDVNNNSVHKLNNKSSKYDRIFTFYILLLLSLLAIAHYFTWQIIVHLIKNKFNSDKKTFENASVQTTWFVVVSTLRSVRYWWPCIPAMLQK